MNEHTRTAVTLVLLLALTGAANASTPTPAREYLDRLLAANVAAVDGLEHYVRCAESAAVALCVNPDAEDGPSLWLAGDEGFVLEGYNRAGGLMIAKRLKSPDEIAPGDVVLIGSLYGDDRETASLVEACAGGGALTILFAPRPASVEAQHLFIDVHAEAPDANALPTASPANAQALWTFTGELVNAMMRRSGRTPPLFVSVLVPDGRERNNARKGMRWDPQNADPMPPGLAGRRYLARMANIMRRLRATQMDEFARVGEISAETLARSGTVWLSVLGHMLPAQAEQVPEDEMPFTPLPGREPDRVPELVKPGDLVLYIGYYEPMGPWVRAVHDAGGSIVTVVSGTPECPALLMGADVNICGCWPYGDALLALSPLETGLSMLPPSGVIQSAAFWMTLAENRRRAR